MSHIIRFIFKANFYFFMICIFSTVFALVFGGAWKIVPSIFLLFFFYEWNISPKINKTWAFIETLPISLMKRYFLRVIFPFFFCFLILFCLEIFNKNGDIDYIKSLTDSLRQSSIFLLSSIAAESLSGYIIWIILLYIIMMSLSLFHFYIPSFLIFMFFYTYYLLSMQRKSRRKFLHIPIFVSLIILLLGNIFLDPLSKVLISVPIEPIQLYSAKTLINDNAFIKPVNNFSFSLNKEFFHDEDDYHYDDKLLQKIESIVVRGEKCSLDCLKLARGVQEFPEEWNLERWSIYLKSSDEAKKIYVLEILRSAKSVIFFNTIMQLAQSENPELSNRAMSIIESWGVHSFHDIPRTDVF